MKTYITPIITLLVGGAIGVGGLWYTRPPSTLSAALELGKKLGLAAAEDRFAEYESGHKKLQIESDEAKAAAEGAEERLRSFRNRSYAETDRLKKVAQKAVMAQEQALRKQVDLAIDLDTAWESLEQATDKIPDQLIRKAVAQAISKTAMAEKTFQDNLKEQLAAAGEENLALNKQLVLKDQELQLLEADLGMWKRFHATEKRLREDAEAYISDVKDSGFYFGVGGTAGYSQLLSGAAGPGGTIGFSAGWRF